MCRSLAEHWLALAATLGVPPEQARLLSADLAARYAEPHRHYHTLDHLQHMFSVIELLCHPQPAGPALLLAVWFHDAIYDPRAADNEEQSAALAQHRLAPWVAPSVLAETTRLIGLTKNHETTAVDHVGQVLLDADLAILAAGRRSTIATPRPSAANMPGLPRLTIAPGGRACCNAF